MQIFNKENGKKLVIIIVLFMIISPIFMQISAAEIDKTEFKIEFNERYKLAEKVSYFIDEKVNKTNIKDRPKFYADQEVPEEYRVYPDDYTNTGYDRGHLPPDANFDYDIDVLRKTYSMAVIVPQHPTVNRGIWADLEELERYIVSQFGSAYVENIVVFEKDRFLEKKPYDELTLKFDSIEKEMKYKEKYLKAAIHLKQKKIGLPVGFYKKIKAGKHKECYYVPNEELKSNLTIKDFKVDCGIF